MTNIYWDETTEGFDPENKYFLAAELAYQLHLPIQIGENRYLGVLNRERLKKPYVEVDVYENQVAIRKIPNLPKEDIDYLLKKANGIYRLVMGLIVDEGK